MHESDKITQIQSLSRKREERDYVIDLEVDKSTVLKQVFRNATEDCELYLVPIVDQWRALVITATKIWLVSIKCEKFFISERILDSQDTVRLQEIVTSYS